MINDIADGGGIDATGVTVTYRNGHTALRDATFHIPKGTVTALVGVNGAGKSTLFKAIMGFVSASQGDALLLGGGTQAVGDQGKGRRQAERTVDQRDAAVLKTGEIKDVVD